MTLRPRLAPPAEFVAVADQWAAITGTEDSAALRGAIASQLTWWLGETPNGSGALAVVEEGGRYLGVAGWCPKTLIVHGEKVPVAEIGTTMTAPDARGRGVFSSLVDFLAAEASRRGIQALYGTPNAASGAPYIGKLGFKPIWPWSRWIRFVRRPAGLAFDLAGVSRGGLRRRGPRNVVSIEASANWDDLAACSRKQSNVDGTYLERSAVYLRWRYPTDRYKIWVARDCSGATCGWVAVGRTERLGRQTMSLADVVIGPELNCHADWFLRSVLASQRRLAPDLRLAFAMTAPDCRSIVALRRAGFVSKPSEWPMIARALRDQISEDELFGPMSFMAGDSDTV